MTVTTAAPVRLDFADDVLYTETHPEDAFELIAWRRRNRSSARITYRANDRVTVAQPHDDTQHLLRIAHGRR